jgi:hypothetical protein
MLEPWPTIVVGIMFQLPGNFKPKRKLLGGIFSTGIIA